MSYYYEFSHYETLCTFDGHSHSHFHGQCIDDGDGHSFSFCNSNKLYKYVILKCHYKTISRCHFLKCIWSKDTCIPKGKIYMIKF